MENTDYNWIKGYARFWQNMSAVSSITVKQGKSVLMEWLDTAQIIFASAVGKLLPIIVPLPAAYNLYHITDLALPDSATVFGLSFPGLVTATALELFGYVLAEFLVKAIDDGNQLLTRLFGTALAFFYLLLFGVVYFFDGGGINYLFPLFSILSTITFAGILSYERNKQLLLDEQIEQSAIDSLTADLAEALSTNKLLEDAIKLATANADENARLLDSANKHIATLEESLISNHQQSANQQKVAIDKSSNQQLSAADLAIVAKVLETADIKNASHFATFIDEWADSTSRMKFGIAKKSGQIITDDDDFYHLAGA